VKKAVALLVATLVAATSACRTTQTVAQGGAPTGEVGARVAVQNFLAAARDRNVQAFTNLWGSSEGAARERMPRQELEQRVYIMMRCLRNDRAAVRSESSGEGNRRIVEVSLTRGHVTHQTTLTAVPSHGRWFVEQVDMTPIRDFCSMQ